MAANAKTPTDVVRSFLDLYETGEIDSMRALCDADIRWLNERTGGWEQGIEPLIVYSRSGLEGASAIRAELSDAVTYDAGDQAVVSGLLTYHATWAGEAYDIPCPTTFVLRRTGDDWKLIYQHALEYRPRTEG